MSRTRKPSIQKAGAAPVMVAEPEPTSVRPADAPVPPRGARVGLPSWPYLFGIPGGCQGGADAAGMVRQYAPGRVRGLKKRGPRRTVGFTPWVTGPSGMSSMMPMISPPSIRRRPIKSSFTYRIFQKLAATRSSDRFMICCPKLTKEIPRLCRGGSKRLTFPAVAPQAPVEERTNRAPSTDDRGA
jgi:hypothetical protein